MKTYDEIVTSAYKEKVKTKYINLDKLNKVLSDDKREAFTKHQVWLLLNYHQELIVELENEMLFGKDE